ncbi:SUZ domain-containing protein 1-like [Engraulis encrasicolus]|uniref:SUZ domain-containing protein 1-like n=1 Tax=Engraulis encrasicolus TaxID=184585 RepID=UPI002FD4BA81
MEDDEVSDNWEDAADSGEIERRLEAQLKINEKAKKSSGTGSSSPVRTAMVIQDESLPAAPPPQIRILKRPSSNGSLGNAAAQNRPAVQVKSLAQREAEYAEARQRILGSASSEESASEKTEKPSNDRSTRVTSPSSSEQSRQNNHAIRQPTGPDGSQGFRQCR